MVPRGGLADVPPTTPGTKSETVGGDGSRSCNKEGEAAILETFQPERKQNFFPLRPCQLIGAFFCFAIVQILISAVIARYIFASELGLYQTLQQHEEVELEVRKA